MAYFPFEEKRRRRRRRKKRERGREGEGERETKLILCVVFSCKGWYHLYGLFEEGLLIGI